MLGTGCIFAACAFFLLMNQALRAKGTGARVARVVFRFAGGQRAPPARVASGHGGTAKLYSLYLSP